MRITSAEIVEVRLPTRRGLKWRGLGRELGNYLIIQVHADNGMVGLGEATVLPTWGGDHHRYYGEDPTITAYVLERYLVPRVVGLSPLDLVTAHEAMDHAVRGYPYAKAAIDMALYDLAGQMLGVPVCQLLGGRYRDTVPLAHMVGLMEDDDAIAEATAAAAEGIGALQVKGGESPSRDIRLIGALRAHLPETVRFRLDANQGYEDVKTAIRAIRMMERNGLEIIEQPVQGVDALGAVTAAVDATVMADESCWSIADGLQIIRDRAADAVSIYVAKAGGLLHAAGLAQTLRVAGIPCDVNGSIETGIGTAANLHLAASQPAITLPCVISASAPAGRASTNVAGRYYDDDLVRDGFHYEGGVLQVPTGPGLGVALDEERLKGFATRRWTVGKS